MSDSPRLTSQEIVQHLSHIFPADRLTNNPTELEQVSMDESTYDPVVPLALAYPISTSEVSHTVRWANKHAIPVTPRGAGTGLSGNAIPTKGSVVLDLTRMNRVLQMYPEDLQILVQPGIILDKLNQFVADFGIFFPAMPGGSSDIATIGGMVSTNASGIYSVKYGSTRNWVNSLTLVLGDGQTIKLGNRSLKRSSGFELIQLFIGSEGTLGIVTEINLQLVGIPECKKRMAFAFDQDIQAVDSVCQMKGYGLDVAAIEYLDKRCIEAINHLNTYRIEPQTYLFLEFHGTPLAVEDQANYALEMIQSHGGTPFNLGDHQDAWSIRHDATKSIKLLKPTHQIIRNDTSVPVSNLVPLVQFAYERALEENLDIFIFGHLGLGIIHALILARKGVQDEWKRGHRLNNFIIEEGIRLGGSTSGEHGIGIAHRFHLSQENAKSISYMKGIKALFDPNNILNPDKVLYQ